SRGRSRITTEPNVPATPHGGQHPTQRLPTAPPPFRIGASFFSERASFGASPDPPQRVLGFPESPSFECALECAFECTGARLGGTRPRQLQALLQGARTRSGDIRPRGVLGQSDSRSGDAPGLATHFDQSNRGAGSSSAPQAALRIVEPCIRTRPERHSPNGHGLRGMFRRTNAPPYDVASRWLSSNVDDRIS